MEIHRVRDFGAGAAVALIPILIQTGVFTKSDDFERFKTYVAENYVKAAAFESRVSRLEDIIDTRFNQLDHKLDKLTDKGAR